MTNKIADSIVSSHVYEIVKTIYSTTAPSTSEETRISVIQSTLGQLRLANIATLDAITTHFTRLIELTSADEKYTSELATALAPCVLRPKTETSLTMTERYSYRLLRDLFAHKEAIFGELKRASSMHLAQAGRPDVQDQHHPRAISSDESNRRANMEERARAIRERSRAPSPGPGSRESRAAEQGAASTHRRDRSQTRFPVNAANAGITSPTTPVTASANPSPTERRQTLQNNKHHSLEVPGSAEASPTVASATVTGPVSTGPEVYMPRSSNGITVQTQSTNGVADGRRSSTPTAYTPTTAGAESNDRPVVEKRDSFTRSAKFARKPAALNRQSLARARDSVGSLRDVDGGIHGHGVPQMPPPQSAVEEKRGVELVDKPMDLD